MRKYQKTEKFIIADVDIQNWNTYDCETCGVFSLRKDSNVCPQCKKECKPIENIIELQNKFKKELGI